MKLIVRDNPDTGEYEQISGNPVLKSMDGTRQSPLKVILHESWTDDRRAEYGIYVLDVDLADGEVVTGFEHNDNGPPTPVVADGDLEQFREKKLNQLRAEYDTHLNEIVAGYTQSERDGWGELAQDAEAGSGQCIQEYADSLGVPVADAAQRVKQARDQYRASYGKLTGALTAARDAVNEATTVKAVREVTLNVPNDV